MARNAAAISVVENNTDQTDADQITDTVEDTLGADAVGETQPGKTVGLVTMKDGRQVDFGKRGKQKPRIEITGEGEDRAVTVYFDCPNGDTHSITVGRTHPLLFELVGYGVKQKGADNLTQVEDPDDISLSIERSINQLNEGKWTVRTSEGSTIRDFSTLLEAYLSLKGIAADSQQAATAKVNLLKLDDASVKTLKANSAIKAEMAKISARKAAERAEKLGSEAKGGELLPDLL
jgi:hypothetical protein